MVRVLLHANQSVQLRMMPVMQIRCRGAGAGMARERMGCWCGACLLARAPLTSLPFLHEVGQRFFRCLCLFRSSRQPMRSEGIQQCMRRLPSEPYRRYWPCAQPIPHTSRYFPHDPPHFLSLRRALHHHRMPGIPSITHSGHQWNLACWSACTARLSARVHSPRTGRLRSDAALSKLAGLPNSS